MCVSINGILARTCYVGNPLESIKGAKRLPHTLACRTDCCLNDRNVFIIQIILRTARLHIQALQVF